jgi:hypothetical protein
VLGGLAWSIWIIAPLAVVLALVGYGRQEGRWAAVVGAILGMVVIARVVFTLIAHSSPD